MEIDRQYIAQTMTDLYPNSNKVNSGYISEMEAAFKNSTQEEFDAAIRKHRNSPKGQFVPFASELARSVATKATYSPGKLSALFFHALVMFGWHDAVQRGMHYRLGHSNEIGEAMFEWMVSCGITESAPKYFGLADWQMQFVEILHSGEVIDAHKYMVESGPPEVKHQYQQAAEFYEAVGNERARGYFTFFRSQSAQLAAPQWLQNAAEVLAKKFAVKPFSFQAEKKKQYAKLKNDMAQCPL